MSFGNFHFQRLEPSPGQDSTNGYTSGRSFGRRGLPSRGADPTNQPQPVRQSSEGYRGKSNTDLTVLTAEGDRVTISLAAQVKYAASTQTGPGGSSHTESTSSSSQVRVNVQGDLNDTELKDLDTLLSNLAKVTSQAGSQPQSTAIPDTGFAGLTSLAAFAYRFQQTVESRLAGPLDRLTSSAG